MKTQSLKCFVIQPFSSPFLERYQDTYEPAIRKAGYDPYRVDQDSSTQILIDKIHEQISESDVCFAEISKDNPNVWYELGYALALSKPICAVCETEQRDKLPFDFQHRMVIFYDVRSASSYTKLSEDITSRLLGLSDAATQRKLIDATPASGLIENEISELELEVLAAIAGEQMATDRPISDWIIKNRAAQSGIRDFGAACALKQLTVRSLVEPYDFNDFDDGTLTNGFRLTHSGWSMLNRSLGRLNVKHRQTSARLAFFNKDNDIPF